MLSSWKKIRKVPCGSDTFLPLHWEKKFCNISDTFQRVIGTLVNRHISSGYFDGDNSRAIPVKIPVLKCVNLLGSQWFIWRFRLFRRNFLSAPIALRSLYYRSRGGISPFIDRTADWDTGLSRHHAGPTKGQHFVHHANIVHQGVWMGETLNWVSECLSRDLSDGSW